MDFHDLHYLAAGRHHRHLSFRIHTVPGSTHQIGGVLGRGGGSAEGRWSSGQRPITYCLRYG